MDEEEAEKLQVLRMCLCHMFCWTQDIWWTEQLVICWAYKCTNLFLYLNPLDGVASESYLEDFMFNFYTDAWSSPNRDEF